MVHQDQSIGAYAVPAMTEIGYKPFIGFKLAIPVIDQDEIVASAVIFIKNQFQMQSDYGFQK